MRSHASIPWSALYFNSSRRPSRPAPASRQIVQRLLYLVEQPRHKHPQHHRQRAHEGGNPEPNQAGMALAARHGMQPNFACERMYLRGDPGLPLDTIFGITSFEAG